MSESYTRPAPPEAVSRSLAVREATEFVQRVVENSGVFITNLAVASATQMNREAVQQPQEATEQNVAANAALQGAVNYNPNVAE